MKLVPAPSPKRKAHVKSMSMAAERESISTPLGGEKWRKGRIRLESVSWEMLRMSSEDWSEDLP